MKVHLRRIQSEGLHLEGAEDFALAELSADDARSAGRLQYSLDLGISEGAIWATGWLSQPVELRCVRCLEWFPFDIVVQPFSLHLDLTGPEEIDLTPFLREDILLNLPPHPHCDREGGRICPAAAISSSQGQPGRTGGKRLQDWSELDKLKLKR